MLKLNNIFLTHYEYWNIEIDIIETEQISAVCIKTSWLFLTKNYIFTQF